MNRARVRDQQASLRPSLTGSGVHLLGRDLRPRASGSHRSEKAARERRPVLDLVVFSGADTGAGPWGIGSLQTILVIASAIASVVLLSWGFAKSTFN